MADRIFVNTEELVSSSGKLISVADILGDVQSALGDVNTSEEAGGDVEATVNTFFRSITGKPTTGSVRFCLGALRFQLGLLQLKIRDTAGDMVRTANLFAETESQVGKLAEGIVVDLEQRAAIRAAEEARQAEMALQSQRHAEMYEWLTAMKGDEQLWNDLFDESWLLEAAGVGMIFTTLNGNLSDVLSPEMVASNIVDKLLDMYGQKGPVHTGTDVLLDFLEGDGAKLTAGADLIKSVLEADGLEGKTYDKIRIAGDSAQIILDAAKKAYEIYSMDPAVIAELKSGLRLNGDMASQHAACILDMTDSFDACFAYCIKRSADKLGEKAANEIINNLISTSPQAKIIQTTLDAATFTADVSFNTNSVSAKAQYTLSVNQMRVQSRDSVLRAIQTYQNAPSEATYVAAKQAYEAYNALSAETANAYRDVCVTNAESAAGKIFYDADEFNFIKDVQTTFERRLQHNQS